MTKHMTSVAAKTIAAALILGVSTATSAIAQSVTNTEEVVRVQFLQDIGASERINFSGKLRMLSQRMPAAACNLAAGVATDTSAEILNASKAEFDKILNGLEFGDADLKIVGQEERRLTLAAIHDLRTVWEPVREAAFEVTEGSDKMQFIADENMKVLGAAKLLVSEVAGQYSDPTALLQSDALRIDIAGRQRMLTQKTSKELCFILSGYNADASRETIAGTVNTFQVSLDALQFGMPEAGIGAAPTGEIEAQLATVREHWQSVAPHIQSVIEGGTLDEATRADVFNGLNKTMVEMNVAVGMFSDSSKLGL